MEDKYKKMIVKLIGNIRFIYFATGFMIGINTINILGESPKASAAIFYPIVTAFLWLPLVIADIVSKMWI